jgi:ubiquinone/menaquinone biosynthesis C-methylase UbiE
METWPESLFFHEHVARYRFAAAHLISGWTLDIACGTGYGAEILAHRGDRRVVGVDIHVPSLVQARRLYSAETTCFIAADGTALPLRHRTFANVVTLETIEHIVDDEGYVAELARILRIDGVCVLSTPDRSHSEREGKANPYHVREYHEDELSDLLRRHFAEVEIYHQGFSSRYERQLSAYARSIQERKRNLGPLARLAIDRIYRPLKRMIPSRISYYFVRKLLNVSYPQPTSADIAITAEPPPHSSVLIAICRQPFPSASINAAHGRG